MYAMFRNQGAASRPRMTTEDLEDLVVHMIRVRPVFDEARRLMKMSDWAYDDERHYLMIVDCLFRLAEEGKYSGGEIPYLALHGEVCKAFVDDPILAKSTHLINDIVGRPQDAEPHRGLLHFAYKEIDPADLSTSYGLDLLQRFLRERQVFDAARRVIDGSTGRTVGNFGQILSGLGSIDQAIGAIGSNPIQTFLPEDWKPNPIRTSSTGIDWLDKLIGGQAARDVNGLLGPFGGGKTTLAIQLAVSRARLLRGARFLKQPGFERPRVVVYAGYEEDIDPDIRARATCFGARIDKDRLEALESFSELSRTGQLLPYELEQYKRMKAKPEEMLGEYERLMLAREEFNHGLYFMDMKNDGRGQGWIPELASQLERAKTRYGWEQIDTVIVDYTKVMVRRHLKTQKVDIDRNLRHYINDTPMSAKLEIAERLGCTVWLLHQLSGESNQRSPVAELSHAHSGEAKDFAENLVNCVVLGVKDVGTQVSRVFYTKGRRSKNSGGCTLVRTDGQFGRLLPAADDFMVSPDQKRITSRSLHNQIHGPTIPAAPQISEWDFAGNGEEDE
jgi:hypothetical protein